ncbi:hypothetical protein Tco_1165335 [Tanacetum coccineum]
MQQQSQQQIEHNTKILEALNIREQPKCDNSRYGSSSDEDEKGDQADPVNQQRKRMPRIKADIPTFLGSLNIEDFLDWVSETEKYFEHMDIPEDSQVKYVAYKLASCNQLSESDAQQVVRFNNGLRYDIQAIVSLQTTWTINEAVCIALKAKQTIKKQGIGSSMYKTKTDTNQSSSSQSGGDAQVDHSKSTHEVDGGKKKTTTTTTSTHAINKSSINPYARPVGNKCFKSQEVSHTSNQCRATKRVNLAEGDKAHSESEDEGIIISLNVVFEDDDDHSEAFLAVGEVRVTEQCEVLFAMGKYKDTVLFDIVDMDCHFLLGRPWQSDMNVVHKGKENTYTFSKGGRKFTLCPYLDEVQATTTKEKKNRIMLKRIFKKKSKKKAKSKQFQAREGKDQVKSKSKVIRMKILQLEGLKLPSLKLYYKRLKRQGPKLPTG